MDDTEITNTAEMMVSQLDSKLVSDSLHSNRVMYNKWAGIVKERFKNKYHIVVVDEHGTQHTVETVDYLRATDITWFIKAIERQFYEDSERSPLVTPTEEWNILGESDKRPTESYVFKTKYDENRVTVKYNVNEENYTMEHPLAHKTDSNTFSNKSAALLSALNIVYTYDSYTYDYQARLKEAAKCQYKKLDNLLYTKDPIGDGVWKFRDLLENIQSYASPTDRTELRAEVESMIKRGEAPEDLPEVKKLSAELVGERI